MLIIQQERFQLCLLSMHRFISWFFLPFCLLNLMSFCTQGFPGVAESTFQKVKENLLPGVRFPSGRLRVLGKVLFPGTHPQSTKVSPLPEGEGNLLDDGFCDFAFGSAQNDRVGSILRRVKVLGIEKPTLQRDQTYQPKGICCYVYRILMMLGTSFFDWFMC